MPAVYLAGMVTISAWYDIQAPHKVANITQWHTNVTGLTQAQLVQIQTTFDSAWATWYLPQACTQTLYLGSKVIDMSSATGLMADNVGYVARPGTGGASPVGDSTAFLLSLHGLLRYRGGHGRLYIPGFGTTASQADGRQWQATTTTAVQNGWNQTVTAMAGISPANGGPLSPAIWHKKKANMLNTQEPVTSVTGQIVYANQRRRVRKVSRHKKHV